MTSVLVRSIEEEEKDFGGRISETAKRKGGVSYI